jgi:hypothetical protein
MTGYNYWNPFSQAERRKEVERDRDCFRTRAESDAALEAQGRFKKTNETTVVGATPSAPVPQQPASSPWGGDNLIPAGGELDYFDTDISAVEPILDDRRDATSANGLTSAVENASAPEATEVFSSPASPVASTKSQPPPFKRRF